MYGLGRTSCEAQRRAVALAEAAGAVIDVGAAADAYAAIGSSTATFGEIRDRAELVVLWRADPVVTHPRLLGRPAARSRRHRSSSTRGAQPPPRRPARSSRSTTTSRRCGRCARRRPGEEAPSDVAERLLAARHVALIHGALDELTALALHSLVRDLARDRHAVTLGLRGDGNARGAEDVLAWQTGFPPAVELRARLPARGRWAPPSCSSEARSTPRSSWPPTCRRRRLRGLPTVVVDARATATSQAARVAFATAADGIEVAGTVHRMDGVPVPLRAPLAEGPPGDRGRAGRDPERL